MSVVASTTAMQIPGDVLEQRDGNNASARERLDGWKEIAAYLRRTIRTAQRWEHVEGLPVLRHQHAKGATVYAYRGEVDRWWQERGQLLPRKDAMRDGLATVSPSFGNYFLSRNRSTCPRS